jgi:beta-lactamase class C
MYQFVQSGKAALESTKPCRTGISCHESPAQAPRLFLALARPVRRPAPGFVGVARADRRLGRPPRASLPAAIADESPARQLPLAAGFNVAGFEDIARRLTENGRVPGMAMAIVHDGHVLSARGYGVTDVNHPEPIDAHTVFRLASLSKAFAGTMTGLLVNDGVLRWDSKVTDYCRLPPPRPKPPTA